MPGPTNAIGGRRQAARSRARRTNPDERFAAIIDASVRIFNEKGFNGSSLQDIADAVGVVKGSLYHYISTKEDLLFEIVWRHHVEIFENVRRFEALEAPADVRLRTFIEWHAQYNMEHHTRASVYHHEVKYLSRERFRLVAVERRDYATRVRDLLQECEAHGLVRTGRSSKLTLFAVLGMLNSLYEWYRPDAGRSADEIAETFADLLLEGLLVPQPDDQPEEELRDP